MKPSPHRCSTSEHALVRVGPVLPGFTVEWVRAGIRGWNVGTTRQDFTVGVNNIGNVLYAEAANASFFRPEPRRNVVLAVSSTF